MVAKAEARRNHPAALPEPNGVFLFARLALLAEVLVEVGSLITVI
jgi:hypothetical protein